MRLSFHCKRCSSSNIAERTKHITADDGAVSFLYELSHANAFFHHELLSAGRVFPCITYSKDSAMGVDDLVVSSYKSSTRLHPLPFALSKRTALFESKTPYSTELSSKCAAQRSPLQLFGSRSTNPIQWLELRSSFAAGEPERLKEAFMRSISASVMVCCI